MTDTLTPETDDMGVLNNLFRSKAAVQVDLVRAKLEAAKVRHSQLVGRLASTAYAAATDEPNGADELAKLQNEIIASDQTLQTLSLAYDEAVRREAERKRLGRHAADKSRIRALQQRLGNLRVNAAAY